MRATPYFLRDVERGADTKNKSERRVSEQERRNKSGSPGKNPKKAKGFMLYHKSAQLAHVAFNFSLYVLSTDDLRAVSMTCDLCPLSKEKETVERNAGEGKNSGYDQRREPIMTRVRCFN
jgi:hypothetical protein